MNNENLSIEKSYLSALKKGDTLAFEHIYNRLYPRLLRFVTFSIPNSEDAEEIVQEVFLKIWNLRTKIELDKSFEAFVFTIAKNQIKDFLRKVLQEKKYIESVVANYSISDSQLEEIIDFRETQKVLIKLIGMLPQRQRKAFILNRFQHNTYREIAILMNISENTVDTHIRKALAFIKEGMLRLS